MHTPSPPSIPLLSGVFFSKHPTTHLITTQKLLICVEFWGNISFIFYMQHVLLAHSRFYNSLTAKHI